MAIQTWRSRILAAGLMVSAGALLAGCDDQLDSSGSARSLTPIPQKTLAKMDEIGTTAVLARADPHLQAGSRTADLEDEVGRPVRAVEDLSRCAAGRASSARRRARAIARCPRASTPITPGQMNPNSNYYLSFNVGYPNAYDRAYGRTGGTIMVHGACSSAGCFSMTDQQIAEIYAIAREAFNGGQRADPDAVLSVQHDGRESGQTPARPEHRVLERAEERLRPFRGHAGRAERAGLRQALRLRRRMPTTTSPPPPPARRCIATTRSKRPSRPRSSKDDAAVAALVAKGVKPIELVYADGGQNPAFAGTRRRQPSRRARRGPAGDRARRQRQADPDGREGRRRRRQQGRRGRDPARRVRRRRHPRQARRDARLRRHHVRRGDGARRCRRASGSSPLGFVGGVADSSKSLDEQPLHQGRRRRNAFAGDPGLRARAAGPQRRSAAAQALGLGRYAGPHGERAKSDDAKPAAATQ